MKQIGIIIPTKDRPYHLIELLDSFLYQKVKPNYIVIISSSNRKNGLLEKRYISIFKHQFKIVFIAVRNINKAYSCNIGISYLLRKVQIMAFIDDDCIPNSLWLKTIINYHKQFPFEYVFGGLYSPYYTNTIANFACYYLPIRKPYQQYYYFYGGNITFKSKLFRNKKLRFNEKYSVTEDFEFAQKCIQNNYTVNITSHKNFMVKHKFRTSWSHILLRGIQYGFGEAYVNEHYNTFLKYHWAPEGKSRLLQSILHIPKNYYYYLKDAIDMNLPLKYYGIYLLFNTTKYIGIWYGLFSKWHLGYIYPTKIPFRNKQI